MDIPYSGLRAKNARNYREVRGLIRCEFVHGGGQFQVQLRHTSGVMGVQRNLYAVVNIKPFGVVVHFFGQNGGLGHKGKGRAEIREGIDLDQRIAPIGQGPSG